VLAHKSRTQNPRNTEIGRKVARPTGNIAHLFQGQKVKVSWDIESIISTKLEGLRTSKLVRRWSMLSDATASYKKVYEVWFLHAGGCIPYRSRPNPAAAATQLVHFAGLRFLTRSRKVLLGLVYGVSCVYLLVLCVFILGVLLCQYHSQVIGWKDSSSK